VSEEQKKKSMKKKKKKKKKEKEKKIFFLLCASDARGKDPNRLARWCVRGLASGAEKELNTHFCDFCLFGR
jgi:hypothetical protein